MTYIDPFGRRYRVSPPNQPTKASAQYQTNARGSGASPTLEDYHLLSDAFQSLQKRLEETTAHLDAAQEALRQQTKSAMGFQDQLILAGKQIDQLTQERDDALTQAVSWQEELAQLRVETSSYRTRLEQRLGREADEKRLSVLRDMLPLADHLELALVYWDQGKVVEGDTGFRGNLVAIRDAFLDTLRGHGIFPQQPVGQDFSPELHEAVGQIVSEEIPADRVALVVRTGYTADDQLLRPARVLISSGSAGEGR